MEHPPTAPAGDDLRSRLFRASSQGIAIARLNDGTIVDANDAFLFLVGRDCDAVLGETIWDLGLFTELGDERARRLLRERGSVDGFDARVRSSTDEMRILRLWAEVLNDDDPVVVLRASDVEDRAAAGARYHELREAEVRYRALVEQIPAITYTQVADDSSPTGFRDVYISPQTTRILGITPYELENDPRLWLEAMHPDDRDLVRRADRHGARAGTRLAAEYRMIARDGREVWFRDETVQVEDPVSGVTFWQGVMLDITEQKRAQAGHAEVEAKYRTLVEQIPAIVYLGEYGEDGDWLYISPQVQRVLGYTPEEWLAHPHPMASFVHPDDIAAVREEERRSQREGDTFRSEYRMLTKDGRWVWILDEAAAVRDATGRPFVLQGTMFDITERRAAEERLRALDGLKNTLLHTLSHDLKGPLTAILGAASTLERLDTELRDEERANLLRTLQTRTMAMNALLTDLLDLDRLDQGIVEPRRFPVDVGQLVCELVDHDEPLRDREVVVRADRVVVRLDRPKVERMIQNLLANAASHTPPSARVWVRVQAEEHGVLIVVDDDGPGVPDELKERVFEPFHRGPATSNVPGSGIGLSLVMRFAELHGGRAWVEDRPGGGASFRVYLPDE